MDEGDHKSEIRSHIDKIYKRHWCHKNACLEWRCVDVAEEAVAYCADSEAAPAQTPLQQHVRSILISLVNTFYKIRYWIILVNADQYENASLQKV